ncbi:hypothetical protein SAMN05421820_107194 [Pedobacter steynii]|uniref:Lipoprotein n=1 Tax=Pedobacter steynii TaxID=430522 RepID=A0A1H0ATI1_9SPHI|nr:hypothetical protein [Pedobacter steynii]NQX41268.1 hypothetical protein [Pedobacter steynii]SDN36645.1 hypothetical protein SAMN05421820_107194 [Pedobacter steynii]
MRIQVLVVFFVFFASCKNDAGVLRIDKYLNKKGFYTSTKHNKIIKSNFYDRKSNLIITTEYSRVGCNLIDSTSYSYNSKQQIVEEKHYTSVGFKDGTTCLSIFDLKDHIKYIYDDKDQILSRQLLKGNGSNILRKVDSSNSFYVKDSLSLLKEYLSDIDFVILKTDPKNIDKKDFGSEKVNIYTFNAVPSILMNYGIPINEVLKSLTTCVKDERIIKDMFVFENYCLTRAYKYKNGLIDRVIIESVKNVDNSKALSTEYFIQVPLSD